MRRLASCLALGGFTAQGSFRPLLNLNEFRCYGSQPPPQLLE